MKIFGGFPNFFNTFQECYTFFRPQCFPPSTIEPLYPPSAHRVVRAAVVAHRPRPCPQPLTALPLLAAPVPTGLHGRPAPRHAALPHPAGQALTQRPGPGGGGPGPEGFGFGFRRKAPKFSRPGFGRVVPRDSRGGGWVGVALLGALERSLPLALSPAPHAGFGIETVFGAHHLAIVLGVRSGSGSIKPGQTSQNRRNGRKPWRKL